MNLTSGLFVYFVTYWTVLFCVLPWGNQAEVNPVVGNAPSAPANPRLKQKFIATGVVAAVIWVIIEVLIVSNVINFHDAARRLSEEVMK